MIQTDRALPDDAVRALDAVRLKHAPLRRKLLRRLKKAGLRTLGDLTRADATTLVTACRNKPKHAARLHEVIVAHLPRFQDAPITFVEESPPAANPAHDLEAVLAAIRATGATAGMVSKYTRHWRAYARWCESAGQPPLPGSPAAVGDYLASLTANSAESRRLRVQSIAAVHQILGHAFDKRHPAVVAGLGTQTAAPERPPHETVQAFTEQDLAQIFAKPHDSLHDLRERAVFFLAFATGLTSYELALLSLGDLRFDSLGMTLTTPVIRRGYTWNAHVYTVPKQDGPFCPVRACQDWIEAGEIDTGPLLRSLSGRTVGSGLSGRAINTLIQKRLAQHGLDRPGLSSLSFRRAWRARQHPDGHHRAIPGRAPQSQNTPGHTA